MHFEGSDPKKALKFHIFFVPGVSEKKKTDFRGFFEKSGGQNLTIFCPGPGFSRSRDPIFGSRGAPEAIFGHFGVRTPKIVIFHDFSCPSHARP